MNKKVIISVLVMGAVIFLFAMSLKINRRETKASVVQKSDSPEAGRLYQQAQQFRRGRDLVKAKESYQEILVKHSDMENIATVQKELESLNMDIILSNTMVPDKTVMHEVAVGDTLGKIAKRYNTTVELIKRSNNLKSDIIRVGQKLRIWIGEFNLLADKSQNVLILKDGNEVVKVYDVSTGENNSTPVGVFKITTKLVDPVWFNRGVIVPPESPDNVLGSRWLGFDLPGYGIHGTVEPETIGKQVTAGCIRMRNEEVEELYDLLVVGTKVEIVD